MSMNIKDLTPALDTVSFRAIINNVTAGKTNGNNKTNYLTITLQDKTGTIDAKLWNAKPEQMESLIVGCVVDVKGDVIKYGEDLQLKLEKIEIYSTAQSEQLEYLKSAPYTTIELDEKINEYLNAIQDQTIYQITKALYEEHYEKMIVYPAASRNHHEFVSGLAYHTVSMLEMAKGISSIHTSLNTDYLYSGIILHDLGKIIELSGPVVPEYTLAGKLLGHISISQAMISSKAKDLNLDDESVIILQHLILSHHGKLEYGSPMLPIIKEAEVIYLNDNLVARINMIENALENVEPGHFSKRVFALENRSFYKPNQSK